jgi:uncharacterized membrane protein
MWRAVMLKRVFPLVSALFFLVFLYFFNTGNRVIYHNQGGLSDVKFERAKITGVVSESLEKDNQVKGKYRGIQMLKVKILTGAHSGKEYIVKNYLSNLFNVHGKAGMNVIVSVDTAEPGNYQVSVYNYYRAPILYCLILFFLGVLWGLGGKKGLKSVIGLVFTLIAIAFLFIPLLYRGYSPVLASSLIVVSATVVTLLTVDGWSSKTISAILGTTCGVVIAGIISSVFGLMTHISGFNTEEAETLIVIASHTNMKVSDLLFAGILIASSGAVMDVAMSVASCVYEIYRTNSKLSQKELFVSGLNVGRDMMGTMANTLILAFTGTSINSLIIIYFYNVNYNQIMNMNMTGIEIIQGLSGSIAVIMTAPIVAFIASRLISVFIVKCSSVKKAI